MKRAVIYLFILVALVVPVSCKKGGCNVIQYVNFSTTVSLVEYNALLLPRQPVIVPQGGVSGLVVMQLSDNQYVAYDRTSTVEPERGCAVELADGGPLAIDPCSGAKYILINGSPAEIAECPLRPYRVYRRGEVLFISN